MVSTRRTANLSPLQALPEQQPKKRRNNTRPRKGTESSSLPPMVAGEPEVAGSEQDLAAANAALREENKSLKKAIEERDSDIERMREIIKELTPAEAAPAKNPPPIPNHEGQDLLRYIEASKKQDTPEPSPLTAAPLSHTADKVATPPAQQQQQQDAPKSTGWGLSRFFEWIAPSPARIVTDSHQNNNNAITNGDAHMTDDNDNNNVTAATATATTITTTTTRQAAAPALSPAQLDLIPTTSDFTPPTPTPAPGKKSKKPSAKPAKQQQKKKMNRTDRLIAQSLVNDAVKDFDPQVRGHATAWAERTVEKLSHSKGALDAAKMRIKIKDIDEIPAHRPWESKGTFGLLDEFEYDSSDDEALAPAWYTLDHVAKYGGPPTKKRKTNNMAANEESTPNGHLIKTTSTTNSAKAKGKAPMRESRTPNKRPAHPIVDSGGNSTSHFDLHPRPSTQPSPMFGNHLTHQDGGNVFSESKDKSASAGLFDLSPNHVWAWDKERVEQERAMTERSELREQERVEKERKERDAELRRTGHVLGSGSFSVPEFSDSDEDEQRDDDTTQLPWTQQPPPAPIPAHASLPTPATAEGAEATEATEAPPTPVRDPVEIQRALAMKHTPAKPTGLRQVMLPSPSVLSDAGGSVTGSIAFTVSSDPAGDQFGDIPDAKPIDVSPHILERAKIIMESDEWKEKTKDWWGGDEVQYSGFVGDDPEDFMDADLPSSPSPES